MASNVRLSGAQTSARSESDIRINPNGSNQIIAASNNLSFTGQAQFYSNDGGVNWSQVYLPVGSDSFHSDPGVDWTSDGTAWASTVGVDSSGNQRVRAFKSTDAGATWTSDATVSGSQTNVDKPMLWVDHSSTSHYQDNIYALWWNSGPTYVNRRTGPSGAWQTAVQVSGSETTGNSDGGDIKTNSNGDVFAFWPSESDQKLFLAKSTDGGATFAKPVQIATTFSSFLYHVPADEPSRGALLYITGGAYRTATLDMVYALWMDLAGGTGCNSTANEPGTSVSSACKTRIWFSASSDGGATWGTPTKINDQSSKNDQFFPRLAVDQSTGALMVIYYDTIGDPGRLKTDVWMQSCVDNGNTWSGAMRVTTSQTDETASGANTYQYGDYIGLSCEAGRFFASWTDRRNGGNEEIWGAPLAIPSCQLRILKSTFSEDEVTLNSPFTTAFLVAVNGFFHEALNFNTTADLSNPNPNPVPAITASIDAGLNPGLIATQIGTIAANLPAVGQFGPAPVVAEDNSLQQALQTFQYPFSISFSNDNAFNALQPHQSAIVTLTATFTVGNVSVTNSANIELAKGEDPYFRDVDTSNLNQPSWLSFDLRFFKMTQGQSHAMFNVPNISDASGAPGYIAQVIQNLNTPGANLNGDIFDGLQQDEAQSALEFHQANGGNLVFNFALARVRIFGNTATTINPVRVFFRLFQAQTTASDFNENTSYRLFSDGTLNGQKIPTLGVQNDANGNPEYVTIPCFASRRINLSGPADMKMQTDPPNARTITTMPGQEVDTFFGCWLDVNQPQQAFLVPNPPTNPAQWDGPWTGTQSINGAIVVAPHQCLIAEIRFDDTPIPPGANSSNTDKLAQRNIAWLHGPNPGIDISRRTPHPIEIRATPPASTNPDELMITWGATPPGSTASLYLPAVQSSDIMKLANAVCGSHRLTAVDANTIHCPVGGATIIPIPKGTARNAGLLTVNLPTGVQQRDVYDIIVQQFTEAGSRTTKIAQRGISIAAIAGSNRFTWMRLLGAFQFSIKIGVKGVLLYPEERLLAWLKWRLSVTSQNHRWFPVLKRYLEQVEGRVSGYGGDPGKIPPSAAGAVHHLPHRGHEPCRDRDEYVGKISGVIYDRFGDFEGFFLLTEQGHERWFQSREREIEVLVRRAWLERFVIAVLVEGHDPHRPAAIVLRRAPRPPPRP